MISSTKNEEEWSGIDERVMQKETGISLCIAKISQS